MLTRLTASTAAGKKVFADKLNIDFDLKSKSFHIGMKKFTVQSNYIIVLLYHIYIKSRKEVLYKKNKILS